MPRKSKPPVVVAGKTQAEIDADNERIRQWCLQHRLDNFAVEIGQLHPFRSEPGERLLAVTTNGKQWQTIALLPSERDKVIAALQAWRDADAK